MVRSIKYTGSTHSVIGQSNPLSTVSNSFSYSRPVLTMLDFDSARKLDQGILIVRFELPYNIWWYVAIHRTRSPLDPVQN